MRNTPERFIQQILLLGILCSVRAACCILARSGPNHAHCESRPAARRGAARGSELAKHAVVDASEQILDLLGTVFALEQILRTPASQSAIRTFEPRPSVLGTERVDRVCGHAGGRRPG